MAISTSSPTQRGRVTAKLVALATWLTGSEPTKPTVQTETSGYTIADGSPTYAPPSEPSETTMVVLSAGGSGTKSTPKTQRICWMPTRDLTDEEQVQMVDYMRGKYGLPFVMDEGAE